jgi:hypothetical protein
VVVLLERKTSSASSLVEVYISPESPCSVDVHRLLAYLASRVSIPPSLYISLCDFAGLFSNQDQLIKKPGSKFIQLSNTTVQIRIKIL